MLKGFDKFTGDYVDKLLEAFTVVENAMNDDRITNISMKALRLWFYKKLELAYGEDDAVCKRKAEAYCNKIFKELKERYNVNNLGLALKIEEWWIKYDTLGYNEGTWVFCLSTLNTAWILDNLENNKPKYAHNNSTYQTNNVNKISTVERRRR